MINRHLSSLIRSVAIIGLAALVFTLPPFNTIATQFGDCRKQPYCVERFMPLVRRSYPPPQTSAPVVERVSVASDGTQGNGPSCCPGISSDGRYIVFQSDADNLVPNDTNGTTDVFLHDRLTAETTRVSVARDGTEADGLSNLPSISGDGTIIAFQSQATNLGPCCTRGNLGTFVHYRSTGSILFVSYDMFPSISNMTRRGHYVATQAKYGGVIYRYNVEARTQEIASRAHDGSTANDFSLQPSISSDGSAVAFRSHADNLVLGDTNGEADIFVYWTAIEDAGRERVLIERVSKGPWDLQANGPSYDPSINSNGHIVAFASYADNLVSGDTNGELDIFVRDSVADQITRVSVSSHGMQANGESSNPSISADGRYVAFRSEASNLVPGDTNNEPDIFVHDCVTGQTIRVSVGPSGIQANGPSLYPPGRPPSISANGRYVAFDSRASNLVLWDTNGVKDVFVADTQVLNHTNQ